MAESFDKKDGARAVGGLVPVIRENKAYLSEIDGAIGDGDHGINMNKGFALFAEQVDLSGEDMGTALKKLGRILLTEIGGSMGPIYGTFFMEMSKAIKDVDAIDAPVFGKMLRAAMAGVQSLGDAKVGDKTLMDTLVPATEAFEKAADSGFASALDAMEAAAKRGWESTKDLQAKVGRASRLGERSIGTLDAGATSCWLILHSLAASLRAILAAS
ncbi:MAG: dihydroxyacetone kinase subunit L [Planctomycetota bacterium]|jgi:dihydroxyacetone kinase-like protein|nr:dihydroxyacetone kinase subunit L [Planctomycetota bacterium]